MRDRLAAASVFAALLFSYAWFFGGSGFNQNATFDLTRALVEQQRLDIGAYAANTADISLHDGRVYSNKAPGLAFVAAVPYALLHAIGGTPQDVFRLNLYLYICTLLTCGVSGALIGLLVYYAVRHRGATQRIAYAIALLTGLGTPLFAYSTMLFAHVPAATLLLLSFLLLDGTFERRPALAGAAAGAATVVNYLSAPVVVILLLFTGRRRDALAFIAGGLPFALLLAAYQLAAFGSPFRTSIETMNPAFIEKGAALGIFHLPRLDALWGITLSPYRGLFFLSPLMLLALLGLTLLEKKRDAIAIGLTALVLVLLNASFNGWHGGYAVGPRYLIAAVPLLAIGLGPIARRARLLFAVVAAVSVLFNVAVTAVDPQPPDVLRDPITAYALPSLVAGGVAEDDESVPIWIRQLYTGHTSTNRVAPDEMMPFQRHAPGSPASEWASFNLGELLFGPGAFASILPWLAGLALIILATRASLRDRHHDSAPTRDTQTERSRSA